MKIFNKNDAKFLIKHQDEYGEKSFETVKGYLLLEKDERKYVYQSKNGNCDILLKNKTVTITKDENIFKINFDNKKNSCLYKNKNFVLQLFILGKSYSYDENLKIFTVIYEIYDETNEKLNTISLSIKEF